MHCSEQLKTGQQFALWNGRLYDGGNDRDPDIGGTDLVGGGYSGDVDVYQTERFKAGSTVDFGR